MFIVHTCAFIRFRDGFFLGLIFGGYSGIQSGVKGYVVETVDTAIYEEVSPRVNVNFCSLHHLLSYRKVICAIVKDPFTVCVGNPKLVRVSGQRRNGEHENSGQR